MRHHWLYRIQRFFILISFIALLGIAAVAARIGGFGLPGLDGITPQGFVLAAFNKKIALISGHAGSDSGAICTDNQGQVTLTEAQINANIAQLAAQRLRRAGASVLVLDEYDERLNGLEVDVLLSLHADSCIEASGYKAARHTNSRIPATEDRLLACIAHFYPATTGLRPHPDTITHDMTRYHAFNRVAPGTPAAILEIGFMGGDRELLTHQPQKVAEGVADSILCFLRNELVP